MASKGKGKGNSFKGKIKVSTKPRVQPIKAGSTHKGDTGGIFTAKIILIRNKMKNG